MNEKTFRSLTEEEKVNLFTSWVRGETMQYWSEYSCNWITTSSPSWVPNTKYRVKPPTLIPDTLNWDHFLPEWKWMARDESGHTYLYLDKPKQGDNFWYAGSVSVRVSEVSTSYKEGNTDWKDSLVERPS